MTQRNALDEGLARDLSREICRNLQNYLQGQKDLLSRGVYGYFPHGKEASLMHLYEWMLKQEIPVAFPRVDGERMDFYTITSMKDFREGAFHIMEPIAACSLVNFEEAYCLVPGSVFDRTGNRYGYGKGYYDRFFHRHPKLFRIGIAYEMQVEDVIWAEDTDVKMQMLATEKGLHVCTRE